MADVNTDNRGKKRASASNAILYTLFAIGAVVMVNLLSTRVFGRLDLTENKTYTLSPSSKDLVKKLPDFLTVKAFISPELPPEANALGRYIRDLVDEYKSASNGKFRWEAIAPSEDEKDEKNKKLEDEAARCKVQKVQIQKVKGQKFELGAYYLGLCFEYGTQMESIPQVLRAEGLEYQITSLIKRMTQRKRKVAFATGHGELDTSQGLQALKEALDREYDVTTVNPSSAEIAKDIDALVVAGPKQAIDEKGLREIDKFLMSGKGAIFLVDGMILSSPGGGMHGMEQMSIKMAQSNTTGLEKILEPYGFKIETNFILDRQAAPGLWDMGGGRKALVTLPAFVTAQIEQPADLPMVQGLRGMVLPYGSSVQLAGPLASGKAPAGAKLWKLASSSPTAWKQTSFLVLGGDPRNVKWDPEKDPGSVAFGYAFQGTLRSAFAPAAPVAESSADKPATESPRPVRLVVMGDSDFANDEYVQLARMFQIYQAGAELLYSAINWTVEDETLTPLRAKTVSPRPIKVSSEGAGTALQIGNMLGVPVAFCLFGVVLWRVRRASRTGQKL